MTSQAVIPGPVRGQTQGEPVTASIPSLARAGRLIRFLVVLSLALAVVPAAAGAQDADVGVTTLTGGIILTPEELATYSQPLVILTDASILEGESDVIAGGGPVPSIPSQVVAGLIPEGNDRYSFSLSLPILPQGQPTSITGVDADGEPLPQVFSVDINSNVAGQPLLTEVDTYGGPGSAFSSIGVDDDGATGQLVVWSSGEGETFPGAVGDDGEALTEDDPVEELEAGWTVVDVNSDTYEFSRDGEVRIDFASSGLSGNDFSRQDWTEAFVSLVDQLEREYPFTDLKGLDFDELRETYIPLVEEAEADEDLDAYTLAIYQFGLEFQDGHVSSSLPISWFQENYFGGFGLRLGQADDGTVYVIEVTRGGPAEDADIAVGDVIEEWGGDDIETALADTPLAVPASAEFARDNQRVELITRAPVGETVEVVFTDADGDTGRVELEAVQDVDGFVATVTPENAANEAAMPIESEVLPSGVGYVRINTFSTDMVLFTHQWDYAIRTFQTLGVTDLVVDVRANGGGLALLAFYASATFADETFTLDTAYVADEDGEFVDSGEEIVPVSVTQWDGGVSVLVDDDCASSCEQFAATMAAIDRDDISIVGHTPSGGVYAAITSWSLPEGIAFQAPFIRYEVDGEIFLEGQGVEPDLLVPVTEESLLSPEDEVLEAGVDAARG